MGSTPDAGVPEIAFGGDVSLPNRADANSGAGAVPVYKPRLVQVQNEMGAVTTVAYTRPGGACTTSDYPPLGPAWYLNTGPCFPRLWDPPGNDPGSVADDPGFAAWHKYAVSRVSTSIPYPTGSSPNAVRSGDQVTTYTYVGGAGWAYDNDPVASGDAQSYAGWRGYEEVRVTDLSDPSYRGGSAVGIAQTQYRLFRGLDGTKKGTGTRSESVARFESGSETDAPALAGRVLESQQLRLSPSGNSAYSFPGGGDRGERLTAYDYQVVTTAQAGASADPVDDAAFVREISTVQKRWGNTAGAWQMATTTTGYDAENRVTSQTLSGAVGASRTTTTTYAPTATAADLGKLDYPREVKTVNGATVLAQTRSTYTVSSADPDDNIGIGEVTKLEQSVNAAGDYADVTTTTYDDYARVASVTDVHDDLTRTDYSAADAVNPTVTVTDPAGFATVTTLERFHLTPIKVVDPNAQTTLLAYDALGRVTTVARPGSTLAAASDEYSYVINKSKPSRITTGKRQPDGSMLSSSQYINARGHTIQTAAVAPTSTTATPVRTVVNTRYDELGREAATSQPFAISGAVTADVASPDPSEINEFRTTYDALSRPARKEFYGHDVLDWAAATTFDGDTVSVNAPVGAADSVSVLDMKDRVKSRTEAGLATTSYVYDAVDRITSITDEGGHTASYGYDLLGRRTSSDDPDTGSSSTAYTDNATTNQVKTTKASGAVTTTTFDAVHRPKLVTYKAPGAAGAVTAAVYAYDTGANAKGRLRSVTVKDTLGDFTRTITGYTPRGLPAGTQWDFPALGGRAASSYTVTNQWDTLDRVKSLAYPAAGQLPAETVTTTYDTTAGLPEKLTTSHATGVYASATTFNGDGTLASRTLANNSGTTPIARSYTYQPTTGRLAGVVTKRAGTTLQSDSYTYNDAGNPTTLTITDPAGASNKSCYTYDTLARLTHAWTVTAGAGCTDTDTTTAAAPAGYNTTWTYNPDGNITSIRRGATTTAFSYGTTTHPHAVTSGPGTYTYDADGVMATRNGANLDADAFGLIEKVGATTLIHEPDGTRLARITPDGTVGVYPVLWTPFRPRDYSGVVR